MYKVAIIDDEPIIVKGLSQSVDWEKFSCQIIGTAYSGEEGLEMIRGKEPDIVFTDIRMPCMDGLMMIAAIKSEFPDIQIAILTGYRDFEYARQAVSLGVTRFLLKPSRLDEIMEALQAMTEKLQPADKMFSVDRMHSAEGALSDEREITDNTANSFIVKNAVAYIEEHYKEKLKLSDVADQVYVSQWHLSKLMNRYMGQNFSEILNNVRINKAKELLKDPSLRIGDIADEVGFQDMAHFSRVFKKLAGISANEYRNQL